MSEYRIISCTKCSQKLRIPANKNINVNCPICGYSFRVNCDSMNPSQRDKTTTGNVSPSVGRFADQLRHTNFQKEESRIQHTEITRRAENYAAAIRSACIISARSGSRSVKGYIHNYVDDGYAELRFESTLPSIEKYKQDAIYYNNQKYEIGGSTYHSGGFPGRHESLLWDNTWYLTKDPAYAESFRSSLLTILKNDGFIGVNLRILNEPVTYVIEDVKASLFSGRMTKTVSSRSTNERVYILEVMVQW